jgi:hypothetical protein
MSKFKIAVFEHFSLFFFAPVHLKANPKKHLLVFFGFAFRWTGFAQKKEDGTLGCDVWLWGFGVWGLPVCGCQRRDFAAVVVLAQESFRMPLETL